MQKLISIISIFSLFSFHANSQNQQGNKGALLIDLGLEYRVTPIYNATNAGYNKISSYVNIDKQNSGPAINVGFEYYILNNLSLGFINSMRYDMVVSPVPETTNEDMSIEKSIYGLLLDYHFNLAYYLKLKNDSKVFISLGWSFFNRNSDFTVTENLYDQNNELAGIGQYIDSYEYSGSSLFLGYSKNNIKIKTGAYFSTTTSYFDEGNPNFIIPTIGITYTLFRL